MRFALPWLRYGLPSDTAKNKSAPLYGFTARSSGFPDVLTRFGKDTSLYGALPDEVRRHRNPKHAGSARPHFIVRLISVRDAPEILISQYFALPEAVGQQASRPTVDALTFLVAAETFAKSMREGVSIDDWAIAVARALARPGNGVRPTSKAQRLTSDDLVVEDVFDRTDAENASLAVGALAALSGETGEQTSFPGQFSPAAFLVAAFRALLGRASGDVSKLAEAADRLAAYGSWPTDPAFIFQAGPESPLRADSGLNFQYAGGDTARLAPDLPAAAHWARAFRQLIDAASLVDGAEQDGRSEQAPTSAASERISIARLVAAPADFRAGLPAAIVAVADALSAVGAAAETPTAAGVTRVLGRLSRLQDALTAARHMEAVA